MVFLLSIVFYCIEMPRLFRKARSSRLKKIGISVGVWFLNGCFLESFWKVSQMLRL